MSHLGRPDGKVNLKMSLRPLVPILEKLLNQPITFISDYMGDEADLVENPKLENQIFLLENLRFHIEEEGSCVDENNKKIKADPKAVILFREKLQSFGDLYINDAFGTSHRAHSSMVGFNYPILAAGYLLKKELTYFSKALESPVKPFLVCFGGVKVTDKIKLILNLLDKVDEMIIGGAMAFPFL